MAVEVDRDFYVASTGVPYVPRGTKKPRFLPRGGGTALEMARYGLQAASNTTLPLSSMVYLRRIQNFKELGSKDLSFSSAVVMRW